jgi:hypothetical protein
LIVSCANGVEHRRRARVRLRTSYDIPFYSE